MASLFKVKALYDFEASQEDDLGFASGQIIDITEEVDDNWLEGKYSDAAGTTKSGIFPREFVEKYEPALPARPVRPARPKQDTAPAQQPEERSVETVSPQVPVASKPQAAPAETSLQEEATSPPPAPKPTPAEPAPTGAKKAPPPVAAKSNAFKDRIAAFNAPAAAPIVPGGPKPQSGGFIKKPFVAPPPSANSYVPPPKAEPVHKPYLREEDPEIRQRQEDDRAAAESAGFTNEASAEPAGDDEEPAPKPQSLKERIALLQKQQMEQAQRRADGSHVKEKKVPPTKKPSESSDHGQAADVEELEQARGGGRQSMERPRVPSVQHDSLGTLPSAPEHEILSDGNDADQSAAGETTEDDAGTIGPEDSDEKHAYPPKHEADVGDEEDTTEDAEEEEDEMDEETRRRLELRERMAKMSGGMGMAGMFGPPGGMAMPGIAAKKKPPKERKSTEEDATVASSPPQQRIPMFPMPGIQRRDSPEALATPVPGDRNVESTAAEHEDMPSQAPRPPRRSTTIEDRGAPPPVPKDSRPSQERGAPPPVPGGPSSSRPSAPDSRPAPPPPPSAGPLSPGPGSESDDELSAAKRSSADLSGAETPGPLPVRTATGSSGIAPPVPGSRGLPPRPPQSPEDKRASYFAAEAGAPTANKRASRAPPPVPGSPPVSSRPAPPPPPGSAAPSRQPTDLQAADGDDRGESEYEGDYDTDIASSAKHKDALKAHVREPSLDDSTTADDSSVTSPTQPRAVPPVPPSGAPPKSRMSTDTPRAPPPMPPARDSGDTQGEDYDPYRYDHRSQGPPSGGVSIVAPLPPSRPAQSARQDEDEAPAPPARSSIDRPAPPPPAHAQPQDRAPPGYPTPSRTGTRQSLDVRRSDTMNARRSGDANRASGEYGGQIATDLNLSEDTQWWTAAEPLPPGLQSRNGVDILSECEESSAAKRGGRSTISKDIYILFIDYSQTIITARYDSREPSDVQLEQDHKPPPGKLRQDELERYWERFGRNIAESASSLGHSKKESAVGDGSPTALASELIKGQKDALQPVGTRAYGALVYVNLANASTMQFDEIRPGDIITVRNAKFEGHHGTMNKKYRQEYGPHHVAIVDEWDGTKRAIRAWEQGREKKGGVRSEKFRLGDLRSGEVRVWRVVAREWVEWGA